jgi:AAA ATPase domain
VATLPVTSDARSAASDQLRQAGLSETRLSRRSSFVGRESEQRHLLASFDAAAGGHGALLMLVGEPGIGKTALCEQLASVVGTRGGLTLVGHCYEEGSFRAPYQPFVEAFGSYLQEADIGALTAELRSGVADLARMAPSLSERFNIAPRPPGDTSYCCSRTSTMLTARRSTCCSTWREICVASVCWFSAPTET